MFFLPPSLIIIISLIWRVQTRTKLASATSSLSFLSTQLRFRIKSAIVIFVTARVIKCNSQSLSIIFCHPHHREALQHEQASEQLVSPSQGGLSSTTGHRPLETLLSIMKVPSHQTCFQKFGWFPILQELPWTPALVIRLLVVSSLSSRSSSIPILNKTITQSP